MVYEIGVPSNFANFEGKNLFFVFHFNLKNEKLNLPKQISYETSYHSPCSIIMNKYERIK